MIIVHEDRDDLGLGDDAESLKTGNAGKRLGCGVIGLAEPPESERKAEQFTESVPYLGMIIGAVSGYFLSKKINN